jgi:hypothetical protein
LAKREYGILGTWVELNDHILNLQAGGKSADDEPMALKRRKYLIAPEKLIAVPILQTAPCIQKLGYAMVSYVICVGLCLIPVKGSSER